MSVRRSALPIAVSILLTACLGPTGRPITGPVPAGTAVQILSEGDTLQLRWTDATAADSGRATVCATRRIDGALERRSGDTLWFRTVTYAEPARRAPDAACQRRGGAIVIAPAASVTIEQLVPVSMPVQIGGSVLFIAVVAGVSLLLFNAADGLFGIVGRWF